MAFADQVHLAGDSATYRVNPAVKKYTLSDLNFKKTKLQNYELTQALQPLNVKGKGAVQVKLSISADLQQLKLAILTGSGLQTVNIFTGDQFAAAREQYHFLMQNLIIRQVLTKN
ncbi:DUF1831 domain-containing protein [Fructilactobacillus ixorae]|uniref:DUF1831 domain-containing protein n=1 Tax=Fructilactobacillus ixorae TaxID=1750535 RepID=A0ABY5C3Y6_9LACO|nr:DUF1831 domain-containing protein [Fructilactobacillus ixorae]USS92888.1 DUF1831 domain-containing protein [Fructilactobacillus ixorae]